MLPAFSWVQRFVRMAPVKRPSSHFKEPSPSASWRPPIRREIEEHFRDFVFYLSRQYHSAADAEGKVVVAATVAELAKLLEQSKVDFFLESPHPTYVINQVHGAGRLLLRRWKSGMAEYRSLIATRKDSGITASRQPAR